MIIEKEKLAREILRLRLSQMIVNERINAGEFKIPIHLALGHEALAVSVASVIEEGDKLLLSHRNMAYNLARSSLKPILDEYLLKPLGLAGGRFGSMNLINPERGIVYTSSVLGNQFPVAVGVSLGVELLNEKGIVIVLGGDGSIEEGTFYESLLMSKSIKAPVLFLVENNEWSMSTKIDERRVSIDLKTLSSSLGIEYFYLEGNDAYKYIEELSKLRNKILESKQTYCIEIKVSTLGDWRGPKSGEYPEGKFINYHHGGTPSVSLSQWPVIKENEEDPIFVLKKYFREKDLKLMAKEELGKIQKEIA